MKKILLITCSIITISSFAQGFGSSPSNWPIPVGGAISGTINYGYWLTGSTSAGSQDVGSKNWEVLDINGDSKSDLVITSEKMSNGNATAYNPTSSPYWKVYLGTGSAFSSSVTNWTLPAGGTIASSTAYSYWLTGSTSAGSQDIGSQNYSLMDMNGDSKPDLVISSEHMGNGNTTVYSPTSNPYWKVYLNTGSGFSTTATNWTLPAGGAVSGTINYSYWLTGSTVANSQDIGSQNWEVRDMNGDSKPDIVITSEHMGNGNTTVYSPSSSPYWKVYLNTGSSFSNTVTNWNLPVGGAISGTINYGYWLTASTVASSQDVGSKNWEVTDMNGDSKPDLVITSEHMTNTTVYSPTSNPYWKVYLNTGSGFSSTITNWNLPVGGAISGTINYGYWLSASTVASSQDVGSKNWFVFDLNGDSKPDLVITSEHMTNTTVYSPTSNPYWKVYMNTGSGFSSTITNWTLPVGGAISGTINYGYWLTLSTVASSQDVGSKNWEVMDLNGDSKPDLVITSEHMTNTTVYSPTSSPYWKVYFGSTTGFKEAENNIAVIIYPNPVTQTITIDSKQVVLSNVAVYNTIGEIMYESKLENTSATIDLSELRSGIYFMKIFTADGIVSKKIIKE